MKNEVLDWTAEQVVAWLIKIELSVYGETFIMNKIDGECLGFADEEMLLALEIDSASHRRKLMREIDKLLSDSPRIQRISPQNEVEFLNIRIYGNQIVGKEMESYRTVRCSPTDIGGNIVLLAMQKFKIAGNRNDYFLLLALPQRRIVVGPKENVHDIIYSEGAHLESTPRFILRNIRFVKGPSSPPLNLEPGTFMAANLGAKVLATAVGVYQYEAQTREELDVYIGNTYAIIARDGEWSVVEENGHRGSVPSRCLAIKKEPIVRKAKCIHSYTRKSSNEISISEGSEFTVLGHYGQWCEIKTNYQQGFIPISYTSIEKLNLASSSVVSLAKKSFDRLNLKKKDGLTRSASSAPPDFNLSPNLNSAETDNSYAVSTRITHMHTFIAFWKLKATEINASNSLKKIIKNTSKLDEAIFAPSSAVLEIILNDAQLIEDSLGWLDEFCRRNAGKIANYTSFSPEVNYTAIRNSIRKNFISIMNFASIIMENAKIRAILEADPLISSVMTANELESKILKVLT